MAKRIRFVVGALLVGVVACAGGACTSTEGDASGGGGAATGGTPEALWARTVVSPDIPSHFGEVAVDGLGNVYAAGDLFGLGTLDFGNGVTATGTSDFYTGVLLKYDSSGTPVWAHSGPPGWIGPLAIDSSGNVFALADLPTTASGTIDFGNGVTVTKSHPLSQAVLLKYDSSGTAQWAQSLAGGLGDPGFGAGGLAMDTAGNLYVAGGVAGTGAYDAGTDAGTLPDGYLMTPAPQPVDPAYAVLVKYDSSGTAQWTRTVTASSVAGDSPHSGFGPVAVDSAGNIYVAGGIGSALGTGTYDFGNGVDAAGPGPVLVKYDASGVAQWVRTWPTETGFISLALDLAGSLHAAGVGCCGTYDFGNGATVTGHGGFAGTACPQCALLVKYDSSGIAQWAHSASGAGAGSYFNSIALDSSGNVYAGGSVFGPGPYDFGNGATVAASEQTQNLVLVKYTRSGVVDWARSAANGGSAGDEFTALTVDSTNHVYAAGLIAGPGNVDFGDNVTLTVQAGPSDGWSALLVKYR